MARVYVFKRFERSWHWAQALLIITMLVSGFEVHGTYKLLSWGKAAELHTTAAWALMGCGFSPSSGTSQPANGDSTSRRRTR